MTMYNQNNDGSTSLMMDDGTDSSISSSPMVTNNPMKKSPLFGQNLDFHIDPQFKNAPAHTALPGQMGVPHDYSNGVPQEYTQKNFTDNIEKVRQQHMMEQNQAGDPGKIPSYLQLMNPNQPSVIGQSIRGFLMPFATGVARGVQNIHEPGGFGRGMAAGAVEGGQEEIKRSDEENKLNNYLNKSFENDQTAKAAYSNAQSRWKNGMFKAGQNFQDIYNEELGHLFGQKSMGTSPFAIVARTPGYGIPAAMGMQETSAQLGLLGARGMQATQQQAQTNMMLQQQMQQLQQQLQGGFITSQQYNQGLQQLNNSWQQANQNLIQSTPAGTPSIHQKHPRGAPQPVANPLTVPPQASDIPSRVRQYVGNKASKFMQGMFGQQTP